MTYNLRYHGRFRRYENGGNGKKQKEEVQAAER